MNKMRAHADQNVTVHLAFNQQKLEALIREGKLHAADFNCLDSYSKKTVWTLLLSAAARDMRY